jgi:hypothetical protein
MMCIPGCSAIQKSSIAFVLFSPVSVTVFPCHNLFSPDLAFSPLLLGQIFKPMVSNNLKQASQSLKQTN